MTCIKACLISVYVCFGVFSSVSALQGAALPYQSLVSSSLTALTASGAPTNLIGQNVNKQKNSINGITPANTINSKPNSGALLADLSASTTGATYDFSALTASALSKR